MLLIKKEYQRVPAEKPSKFRLDINQVAQKRQSSYFIHFDIALEGDAMDH
jgi:hypothetical protein